MPSKSRGGATAKKSGPGKIPDRPLKNIELVSTGRDHDLRDHHRDDRHGLHRDHHRRHRHGIHHRRHHLHAGPHFHEAKTARTSRHAIIDHLHPRDIARLGKKIGEVVFRHAKGQIAHIQFHTHLFL